MDAASDTRSSISRGSTAVQVASDLNEMSVALLEQEILGRCKNGNPPRSLAQRPVAMDVPLIQKMIEQNSSNATNPEASSTSLATGASFSLTPYINELNIKLMKLVHSPLIKANFPFTYPFYNNPLMQVSPSGSRSATFNAAISSSSAEMAEMKDHFASTGTYAYGLQPSNFYSILPKTDEQVTHLSLLLNQVIEAQDAQGKASIESNAETLDKLNEAAQNGFPLALFWLSLSYKHGWSGLTENPQRSFACLVMAAYLTTLFIYRKNDLSELLIPSTSDLPGHIVPRKRHKSTLSSQSSPLSESVSSFALSMKSYTLPSLENVSSRSRNLIHGTKERILSRETVSLYDPSDLGMFLGEIAHVFEYGIEPPLASRSYSGISNSLPAVYCCLYPDIHEALYFYELAAALGDIEAATQLGDLYCHGFPGVKKNKLRAAIYYRWVEAHGGRKLVNCTWIYKKKWGGTE